MRTKTTLRDMSFEEADARVSEGAAYVDLRRPEEYLDVHIPGSLALLYERGPGMASRARDCIPLEVPLILLNAAGADMAHAAASLRGKGFDVIGHLDEGLAQWSKANGNPASTEVVTGAGAPQGITVLDVADPGASVEASTVRIPVDQLWSRTAEISAPVAIAAGRGVRATLAVGILERAGITDVALWRTV